MRTPEKIRTPEQIAEDVISRFPWHSNVVEGGCLVGQQVPVAQAISEALAKERRRGDMARAALFDAAIALNGASRGFLKPKGRKVRAALAKVLAAIDNTASHR